MGDGAGAWALWEDMRQSLSRVGQPRKAEGLGPSLFYTQVCFAAGKGGRSLSRSVTPQVNPTPCWIALSCPRGGRSDASRSG